MITASDLINILQKIPPDAPVRVNDGNTMWEPKATYNQLEVTLHPPWLWRPGVLLQP
jgi:hypothetical protein